MTEAPPPEVLQVAACDAPVCPGVRPGEQLVTKTWRGVLCCPCWHRLGCPGETRPPTIEERHAAELKTREKMLARGGNDRYSVRSGKAGV